MPGSSLWLIPPAQSKLHSVLESLITRSVPARLANTSPPTFSPHVTLTSDLPADIEDPQAWLDALQLPFADRVQVRFQRLEVEKQFFRKCNIAVEKAGLSKLALECRMKGVEREKRRAAEWVESEYRPHCSLLYADIDIPDDLRAEIEKTVADAGISLNGEGDLGGWQGGTVWLVPTYLPIEEWKPIAQRWLTKDIKKAYATAGS